MKKHAKESIFDSIGVVILFKEFINLINWINEKADTRLYHPDSLKHLDKADAYLKKYYSK